MASYYGIDVDGPDKHVSETKLVLDTLAGNPAGKAVLQLIKNEDDDLTIVPYTQEDFKTKGSCNAYARPDKGSKYWAPDGVLPYLGTGDDPSTEFDERTAKVVMQKDAGTGKGTDVKLHFTASLLGGSNCSNGQYGSSPDVVLLHEMVHALRAMQGLMNPVPTKNKRYKNEEEFLAINVANVYISAGGSTLLRHGHNDYSQLPAHLATSAGFLSDPDNLELMSIYLVTWRSMYEALGPVRAQFNPFGEMLYRNAQFSSPPKKKLNFMIPRYRH